MRQAMAIGTTTSQGTAPGTLVVGLGVSGLATARYLAANGVPLAVCDTRDQPPGLEELRRELPDVAVFTGGFDAEAFAAAERLVVSPGVPLRTPVIQEAIARGVEVIGDVELFLREAKAPVVAITGSNGKSTVTTLLGEMAMAAGIHAGVGGNLGKPVLELLDDEVELYILELSSFQLETTYSLSAQAAVILNLCEDHMDRYDSFESYVAAKRVIYRHAGCAIVNRDDALAGAQAEGVAKSIGFTMKAPQDDDYGICEKDGENWLCKGESFLMPVSGVLVAGRHNQANVLAALALGEAAGLPMEPMLQAVRSFHGLAHRTQFVAEIDGVRWYNDSKGTNIGACVAALEGLDTADGSLTVLIAGGDCKGADFSELAPALSAYVRTLVLIGRDAPGIARAVGGSVETVMANDLVDAVRQCRVHARPGDRVLLSPACASFDMFRSYLDRGEQFMQAVRSLQS
ncbi:MAG: UDP-N-acetylmuramoyl-L-alanine--D-glutamate ligase [Chromatiales bacterium]